MPGAFYNGKYYRGAIPGTVKPNPYNNQYAEQQKQQYQANQKPSSPAYKSPYEAGINQALSAITNMQPFRYDPGADVGLQAAQNQAIGTVSRGAARRGMLYSDSNKAQMNEAALNLVPQYENVAFNRYQSGLSNAYNQLNALSGLENTNYGRYRDTVADERYITEQAALNDERAFNRGAKMADITGYYNPYYGMAPGADSTLRQYGNDYQAEINRRMAINPYDPEIQSLQALRAEKTFADPALLAKYGQQYRTMQGQQNDQIMKANDITNQLNALKLEKAKDPDSPENRTVQIALQKAEEELRRIQAVDPNFESEKARLELKRLETEINNIGAGTALGWAQLAWQKDPNNPDNQYKQAQIDASQNKGGLQYKDYISMGRDMLDKGNYDSVTQSYSKMYSMDDVIQWVKGLPLTPDERARLANDLGLQKPTMGPKRLGE